MVGWVETKAVIGLLIAIKNQYAFKMLLCGRELNFYLDKELDKVPQKVEAEDWYTIQLWQRSKIGKNKKG